VGFLTDPPATIRWLLRQGLLAPAEVVSGAVTVRDRSRSNPVHAVEVGGTARWFVKWATDREPDEAASSQRERDVYVLASTLGDAGALPRLAAVDEDALALETVEGVAVSALGDPGPHVLAAIGHAIGRWHERARSVEAASAPRPVRPWVLRLFGDEPPSFLAGHAAIPPLLEDAVGAAAAVDVARSAWKVETVIHGDLRWDNCLWQETAGRATLLDWEFAGWGDPAWDLAGLLADPVAVAATAAGPDRFPILARPLIAATVDGYVAAGGSAEVVDRSFTLLPARLLVSACQQATWAGADQGGPGRMLARLAAGLAEEPGRLRELAAR